MFAGGEALAVRRRPGLDAFGGFSPRRCQEDLMVSDYPRGSEWRKWDLHLHAPGTKLNDGYTRKDGRPDLEQFCQIVHDSEVAVIAVTDYFSLDGYFDVREKYSALYPRDNLLILPNLELRLSVAVNRQDQEVNLHLIFRPSLTRADATKFLNLLRTAATVGPGRAVTCAELSSKEDFESASVSIDAIVDAIKATFGDHSAVPSIRQEHLLVVASAKGDGIRPGGSGVQRKKLLTDEIDKFSDAFFANTGSRDHFLRTDRLETSELIAPKPVFDGSDAHSFEDLNIGLGKQVTEEGRQRNVTWIKADPTYAGLLQTLIEPADRVAMQATEPDLKEPYKVISEVRFTGTDDFPSEVYFNGNLNAVIGSRSSGKSALLAFIAHAVDPAETIRIQMEAAGALDAKSVGPAAGFSWSDVSNTTCEVVWASGANTMGKVIYVPQNSLYTLSEKPDVITKKIAPALFRAYPAIKTAYDGAMATVASVNSDIKSAVDEWFDIAARVGLRIKEISDLGDKTAIAVERDRLQAEIDRIKVTSELTDDEVAKFQQVAQNLDTARVRLTEVEVELSQLAQYVAVTADGTAARVHTQTVEVNINLRPSVGEVPEAVAARIEDVKAVAAEELVSKIEDLLVNAVNELHTERANLRALIQSTTEDNADLIAKHEANEELSTVVAEHKKQITSLDEIAKRETSRERLVLDQSAAADKLIKAIADRNEAFRALEEAFNADERVLSDLKFGIESAVPADVVEHASLGFNQRSVNDYIKNKGELVAYEDAQGDPKKFLQALHDGKVNLNKRYEPSSVAADVLSLTQEIRFSAELDSDRIGGFSRSSMTPGKQALFALTLILNESQEPWPLLIDQPEDDLDSRSIYDTIVPYLTKRKRERQIIMVSHNANLVIGADSEQIIVANRHGSDRRNKDSRTFEYYTGALEHSRAQNEASATALGRFGIREHACEILDGGEEAFRKRREKYKIRQS